MLNNVKVVHTFVPSNYDKNHKESFIIWKDLMYPQLLSTLLSQREFGNITLYTNSDVVKQIEEIGLPYSEINTEILNGYERNTFSSFKLKVFESIVEPFLHIDTDTLIFSRLRLENSKEDIVFAHPDQPIRVTRNIHEDYVKVLSELYGAFFYVFHEQHSDFKKQNFKISNIPNMNIVFVKDTKSFSEATRLSLEHYENNRKIIDSQYYGACYIEQLMIHLNLMEISEKYHESVKRGTHVFAVDRFLEVEQERSHYNFSVADYKFPLTFRITLMDDLYTKELNQFSLFEHGKEFTKKITIPNEEEFKKFFNFDFFGVEHVTFYKWSKIFQCMCIGYIANNFGEEWLYKVHNHYKKFYPQMNLPVLSEGEKLYEELTGFRFSKQSSII